MNIVDSLLNFNFSALIPFSTASPVIDNWEQPARYSNGQAHLLHKAASLERCQALIALPAAARQTDAIFLSSATLEPLESAITSSACSQPRAKSQNFPDRRRNRSHTNLPARIASAN